MLPKHQSEESNTQRLEAFSDGVFAIAITLLVLDMRVPNAPAASQEASIFRLGTALLSLWPAYLAYAFSFLMIGIFWVSHHYVFTLYKRTDQAFLLFNVLFLMLISFLPFPTYVLARWVMDPQQRRVAVFMYTLALFLPAFAWLLTWLYASRNHRLIDRRLDPDFISYLTRRYAISNSLYFLAVLLALWNGIMALALCVGLTLIYLIPLRDPVYRDS
jgi:uncharacterized membrane protein